VLATSAHAATPFQRIAERTAATMMHTHKFVHGDLLEVYMPRHGSHYNALVRDCNDPALAGINPPYTAQLFAGGNISFIDCATPWNVLHVFKMPSRHDYDVLGHRAFYGVWRAVNRAAHRYQVQRRYLKSVAVNGVNGGRVALKYRCYHLHDMQEVRLNYNVHGQPVLITRSCSAQGRYHVHAAWF
jgi:hypothetical protein